MKQWTQGWLLYGPKKDCDNYKFVEKVSFRGFDEENVILQNAIKELETGISGMLSLKPSISFEESLTDGLQIVKSADTPAEGYKI